MGLYEVWWPEQGELSLRAKFRRLGDALRYVARYEQRRVARLRAPDGTWSAASEYDLPAARGRAVSTPPPANPDQAVAGQSAPGSAPTALPRVDASSIVNEVMRRTGFRHADLVERVVLETLRVLRETRRATEKPGGQPRPRRARLVRRSAV